VGKILLNQAVWNDLYAVCDQCETKPANKDQKVCSNCGNPLTMICPACSHAHQPAHHVIKFCEECGAELLTREQLSLDRQQKYTTVEVSYQELPPGQRRLPESLR
jgi:hypothetical protein